MDNITEHYRYILPLL